MSNSKAKGIHLQTVYDVLYALILLQLVLEMLLHLKLVQHCIFSKDVCRLQIKVEYCASLRLGRPQTAAHS